MPTAAKALSHAQLIQKISDGDANQFSEGRMARIPAAEVFAVGMHRGKEYTDRDLEEMVENFNRLRGLVDPTAVIGHEEEQPLVEGPNGTVDSGLSDLDNTGIPAVGWVEKLWKKGPSLFADIERVPPSIAKLINAGAYRKVSAEVYDNPPEGCTGTGKVFRRVAFLGGELPQIKRLGDLPMAEYSEAQVPVNRIPFVFKFSEIRHRPRAGTFEVFLEKQSMDRQAMLDFLAGQGVDVSQITEAVPDECLAAIVKAWQAAQSQDVNAQKNADGAAAMTPDGTYSDGTGIGNNTPQTNADCRTKMGEGPKQDKPMTDGGTPASAVAPAVGAIHPSVPAKHPEQVTIKYSELEAKQNELQKQIADLTKFAEQRRSEEKRSLIKTRLDNLISQGKVLPAERDRLSDILFAADSATVMKFSEGGKEVQATMLDRLFQTLELRPQIVSFAERLKQPDDKKVSADRKAELLGMTSLGKAALANRKST